MGDAARIIGTESNAEKVGCRDVNQVRSCRRTYFRHDSAVRITRIIPSLNPAFHASHVRREQLRADKDDGVKIRRCAMTDMFRYQNEPWNEVRLSTANAVKTHWNPSRVRFKRNTELTYMGERAKQWSPFVRNKKRKFQ